MPYSGNTCMTCGAQIDPEYHATHDRSHAAATHAALLATEAHTKVQDLIESLRNIWNM